jgi:hypothetical protein
MMTKKRLTLLAVLPLTIVVIFGVLAMLPPRSGVTKANFDRIKDGMDRTEVEEILGGKAHKIQPTHRVKGMPGPGVMVAFWGADDGSGVWITFMAGGVAGKHWQDSTETIPDKIRRWLHLK